RSSHGGHETGLGVHSSNDVVVSFRNIEVSRRVKPKLVRHVEARTGGRTAVATIALFTIPGDGRDLSSFEIQPTDALVVEIAEVQRPVRSNHETVRVIGLGGGVTRDSGAKHRMNFMRLRTRKGCNGQRSNYREALQHAAAP